MFPLERKEDPLGMERCSSWKGKKTISDWKDDHLGKERRSSRKGKVILFEKEYDPLINRKIIVSERKSFIL
jgi:hypothetical protein